MAFYQCGSGADKELDKTSSNPVANSVVATKIEEIEGIDKTTTFNADGSITSSTQMCTENTVFNADGSITETKTYTDGTVKTKTTIFNADGSISEVYS